MTNDRLNREKQFHNKSYAEKTRSVVGRFYSITKRSRDLYETLILENAAESKALEYGCGTGSCAFELARRNVAVTAIDISEEAIDQAKTKAAQQKLPGRFMVMNAEQLEFDDRTFNLVCGTGILHHLELKTALAEIARVITREGKAVFLEPLGHNPLIRLYRKVTPALRTVDEHPLLMDDLKLMRRFFGEVEVRFFYLTALAAVPFRQTSFFNVILRCLEGIDNLLFRLPLFRKQAWIVILTLRQPLLSVNSIQKGNR